MYKVRNISLQSLVEKYDIRTAAADYANKNRADSKQLWSRRPIDRDAVLASVVETVEVMPVIYRKMKK